MGNTSSVRVHFPASYVRLPECNRYEHNLHPHKTVGLKRHRFLHSLTASIIMTLPQLHYTSFPTLDVAQRDRNDLAMTAMTHDGFPWDGLVYLPIHECVDFLWVHVGKYTWMLWVSVFFFIYFFPAVVNLKKQQTSGQILGDDSFENRRLGIFRKRSCTMIRTQQAPKS